MLVLVCGLPGTGKSTLSRKLAKRINATLLKTDSVRRELFDKPSYNEEEKEVVYRTIFIMARYLLPWQNVVIDGTFYRRKIRHRVYEVARRTGTEMQVVECTCPEHVIRRRMERRVYRTKAISDADYDVYLKIKRLFEPINRRHIVVDTSGSSRESIRKVLKELERWNK